MKAQTADVIVLGVGSMGAAACHALSLRGLKVLGLEQYSIGHDKGSANGETRILRRAYFEHPSYIPLLNRAYGIWDEWNASSDTQLVRKCGMIVFGTPECQVIRGIETSQAQGIEVEHLDHQELSRRFPMFRVPDQFVGRLEKDAGFVFAEPTIRYLADEARRNGATIKENETVVDFRVRASSIQVRTDTGQYECERLVVCAGAWTRRVLESLSLPLRIERKLLAWYPFESPGHVDNTAPCFAFSGDSSFFYGFPSVDGKSVKVADHLRGPTIAQPEHKVPDFDDESESSALNQLVANHLPFLTPSATRKAYCMYTMTPDEHFLIDHHPDHPGLVFATGFSGHGFKFVPVIGEILADLATAGRTSHPIDFLRLRNWPG